MSNAAKKFSPEVRARCDWFWSMRASPGAWTTLVSIAGKIGYSGHTLNGWVKKADVETDRQAGVPAESADPLTAVEREVRELRRMNEILRKASAYFT